MRKRTKFRRHLNGEKKNKNIFSCLCRSNNYPKSVLSVEAVQLAPMGKSTKFNPWRIFAKLPALFRESFFAYLGYEFQRVRRPPNLPAPYI